MSTVIETRPDELSDLADCLETPREFPVEWLSPLNLGQPRRGLECLSERTRLGKRILDLIVAATLLVLLAPVMLLVALLVRLTSPGPIIFRQLRVGLNLRRPQAQRRRSEAALLPDAGASRRSRRERRQQTNYGRPFVLYKFRTMRVDAEKNGAQFAVAGDVRVTPIGRFLRLSRLDELPQLWNVLRGEMSMVGPRPERPEFIAELSRQVPGYLDRLGLKPGLTGLAQVINGYDNNIESFRRKIALDLLYLQNCCVWNDLKIMLRTVGVVLTGKGAM